MKRTIGVVAALVIVVSACGGSDEPAASSTSVAGVDATVAEGPGQPSVTAAPATQAPVTAGPAATTAAPTSGGGSGSSSEFCGFAASIDTDPAEFGLDPTGFKSAMEETLAALEQARSRAPAEIAGDVQIVLDTFKGFVDLLEEHDYNLLALGSVAADDPRVLRFNESEFTMAVERIGSYCGVDLNSEGFGAGQPTEPGDEGTIPAAIPQALVPPNMTSSFDLGAGSYLLSTSDAFADIADFYEALLGPPVFLDDGQMVALWNADFEGVMATVSLAGTEDGVEVVIALVG